MPEERPRRTAHGQESPKISASGWQLIAVQSISCLIVIIIVVIFRMAGGSAFSQLRESFNQSIMDNSILATLAGLWENPGSDDVSVSDDSDMSGIDSSLSEGSADMSSSLQENSNASAATTAAATSAAAASSAKTTAAASGGSDLLTAQKILYAPKGASFVLLKTNRVAFQPLVKGVISSGYGYRENPTKGGESFHQGLDIAADSGTPIAAMYFGVVSEVGKNASYGNYIRLYHGNGLEVLYAHCSEIVAQKGAAVNAGDIVAKVGSTGDSTGPHVHIEVKLNGINYNPSAIVSTDAYA